MLTLWIPLFPLLGFLLLGSFPLWNSREPDEKVTVVIGVGSVALAALATAILCVQFYSQDGIALQQPLWQWLYFSTGSAEIRFQFGLHFDALSAVMACIITGVGVLIHLYAAGYMHGDGSYRRFFAYLNLFVFSMLVLVLADNLVLLYLGWEGVGLCSYLLIGFWYRNPDNGLAARKAFVITRIGDTAMLVGLILLLREFGTLEIGQLLEMSRSPAADPAAMTLASLLLLGGAVGKSAQVPLQTWLPDAMAGPTPVSALIHAATMVTAGVYLIARCHDLFLRSDLAMIAIASIGTLTLLLAGISALVQTDLKRILAYSTISQLGYMFLGLGAGAFSAAIFHLMTHAFFKALLFLAAGSVILSLHHEQDVRLMGGLRKKLPLAFFAFAAGCAALAALPFTSGYFSKDLLLLQSWENFDGANPFWAGGIVGALITGMYSFRLLYLVFFGPAGRASQQCKPVRSRAMAPPLLLLGLLALFGGAIPLHLEDIFGAPAEYAAPHWIEWLAIAMPLLGIGLWYAFHRTSQRAQEITESQSGLRRWLQQGWGFDRLYELLFVLPLQTLSHLNRRDLFDGIFRLIGALCLQLNLWLSRAQSGLLRSYIGVIAAGIVAVLLIAYLALRLASGVAA
ncbi:NADH-quinone oxidoreductase subunit L [uncultured Microbulbifer sp.]|uniref:NADH-quinone oxidoreductase subunit L n=1 Tax=uncultured Microbulbifer sp. TaxID=348147 RepID=UPI0025F2C159|nr:NADH-quinone oxidoreductase subunit L [uncultured Microbulbifer sp.]